MISPAHVNVHGRELLTLSIRRLEDFVLVPYIFGKTVAAADKPLRKQRRVVVTGLGVISPVGHEPDIYYNNLLEGVSGISEIEGFDCAQFRTVASPPALVYVYLFVALI